MSRKKLLYDNLIGERINKLRMELGLPGKIFSKKVGISQGYLSDIETGKSNASKTLLLAISYSYNASFGWLLTGEGEMKKSLAKYENTEHNIKQASDSGQVYSGVTEKIIIMLEGMAEEQKRDILKYIEKKQLIEELLEERRFKKAD